MLTTPATSLAGREAAYGRLQLFMSIPMKTNFYIDGFNFYYGAVRRTSYKWLDFSKLFSLYFPDSQINRIRYFTARVRPSRRDPLNLRRQLIYIRALETIPNLSVHYGYFLTNRVRLPLANPPANGPATAQVLRTEEKGTDVNLATQLLADGFRGDYELAIVVSNDSDYVGPIRLVRDELGLQVGLLNPQKRPSRALIEVADFYRTIRPGPLSASLFPDTLTDATGTFRKPASW